MAEWNDGSKIPESQTGYRRQNIDFRKEGRWGRLKRKSLLRNAMKPGLGVAARQQMMW